MHQAEDDYTPRDRGLLAGEAWMTHHVATDGHELEHVLDGEITASLGKRVITAGLRERLDASTEPDADTNFWNGFIDGVRAYINKTNIGATEN